MAEAASMVPGGHRRREAVVSRTFPCTTITGPGNQRIEVLILHASEDLNRKVRVLAPPDLMRCFLHYVKHTEKHEVSEEELSDCLLKAGVNHGVDADAVRMLADLLNLGQDPVGPFELAKGSRPQPGKNGWIEFKVRPSSRKPRYDTDRSGKMDFRRLNLIENVLAGHEVALLHPPTAGVPGTDILGNPLPAADGKPLTVRVGRNVTMDESEQRLLATADGFVVLEHNVVSLETAYKVTGDVDYHVGNIDFVGSVEVLGNVLDDFEVHGKKGVTINGNAGASVLGSDGDITLLGGMNGRGKGRVVCGGAFEAKYINDTDVEAGGDVVVRREIINARVLTHGSVRIRDGAIVGGKILAMRGIEARTIGSDLGVATKVTAGMDWRTEEKVALLDREIATMNERMQAIKPVLDPLLQAPPFPLELEPEQKELLRRLVSELREARERLCKKQEERATLVEKTPPGRISQVNVRGMLHQGVTLRFSHLQATVKRNLRGPLSAVQDLKRNVIRVLRAFELSEDDAPDRPWLASANDISRL